MTPYINAWLDCSSPHITINDAETGDLIVHYNSEEVSSLFFSGEISHEQVQSRQSDELEELLVSLLLFKSTRTMEKQLEQARATIRQRDTTATRETGKPTLQQVIQNIVAFPSTPLQATG